MAYLVELVIKFPIDWHCHLKTLIFDRFSQKKDDVKKQTPKFRPKNTVF